MVQNLKWATAHLSRRLAAGLSARQSDTARRRGARHAGGHWASVRAGCAGRARGWACWDLGRQALGRWGGRRWGAQGERARGALAGVLQAGDTGARQAGARGTTGWAAWARPGRAAGPGWVFWCT